MNFIYKNRNTIGIFFYWALLFVFYISRGSINEFIIAIIWFSIFLCFQFFMRYIEMTNVLWNLGKKEIDNVLKILLTRFSNKRDIVEQEFTKRGLDLKKYLEDLYKEQDEITNSILIKWDTTQSSDWSWLMRWMWNLLVWESRLYYFPYELIPQWKYEKIPFGFMRKYLFIWRPRINIEPYQFDISNQKFIYKKSLLPLKLICMHIKNSFLLFVKDIRKITISKSWEIIISFLEGDKPEELLFYLCNKEERMIVENIFLNLNIDVEMLK